MRTPLFILLLFATLTAAAQKPVSPRKAYKPIRTALKAKKPADALATIRKLAADTTYNSDPRLYAFGVEAQLLLCEGFNEKLYLGQKIDTAQFFTANYDLCLFILQCDTAEQRRIAAAADSAAPRKATPTDVYRRQHRPLLKQYYPNLSAAGRFHYRKRQFAEARKYFAMCFALPEHPLWGSDTAVTATPAYRDNIYLDFRAMYELKQYDEMPARTEQLLADSVLHGQVLDMLVTAANGRGDSTAYFALVEQGLREDPARLDYFAALANRYTGSGNYAAAVALADTLLAHDPMNPYFLICRSLSLFKLGRLEESVIAAERLVAIDSTAAIGYYILGYNLVDRAEKVQFPRQTRSPLYQSAKQRQTELFTEARTYVERLRELAPDEPDLWAPLLYKIYLNLNLGKEFEEIERLLAH
ncbi:MAG: hypothetical protein IJS89_07160 [Bacteroidaceae bacterium]|nr:hypothetical protein [Bacteroidaceae bacterium]